MSKNNKKKTKPQIELPGKYVYILIITSYLILSRVCLKNKNCTKRMFYFPFHDKIKKKGCSLC